MHRQIWHWGRSHYFFVETSHASQTCMSPLKWIVWTEHTDKHHRLMVYFISRRLSARFPPPPQAESSSRDSAATDWKQKVLLWISTLLKGRKQKVGTNGIFAKGERLQKFVLGPMLSNLSLNDLKMSTECSVNLQMILNFSGQWSKEKKKRSQLWQAAETY